MIGPARGNILSRRYNMVNKIKVVTAKIGLDDHYRGVIAVTEALRDAGMEVVYLGTGQRIEGVIKAVIQEDTDVLGLSFLCGGHLEAMRRVMNRMKEENLDHVVVVIGGVIPPGDVPKLEEMGVAGVFLPGIPLKDIANFLAHEVEKRARRSATL